MLNPWINIIKKKKIISIPMLIRMVFTTNHDENSWNGTVYERFGDAVKTFAVLCGVVKGMPLGLQRTGSRNE